MSTQDGDRNRVGIGVLIPHFGPQANRQQIVDGAAELEALGFDSVWVRDHVVFRPYAHEGAQDRAFWEPLLTLAAVAAVTDRLVLGTGCLVPHRHPLYAAQALSTLDALAGSGRVVVGMGLGSFGPEFEALGMGGWDRRRVLPEYVEILRGLWKGTPFAHDGEYYSFEEVQIAPTPTGGALPIWHGGASEASARRAVEVCDGWISGRIPRRDLRRHAGVMREIAEKKGLPPATLATIPYVVPATTVEEATSFFDVDALLAESARWYSPPPSGQFTSIDDLDGALIAGPSERIVEETMKYVEEGVEHVVFDLRPRFDAWDECIAQLAEEVVPAIRRETEPR